MANTLLIGKPGTGKTTYLVHQALDDIHRGLPVVFLDFRGDAVADILAHIPKGRSKQTILFDPSLSPFSFNLLADVRPEHHPLLSSAILEAIKGVWNYTIPTPTLDQYFRAGIQTLLSVPDASLVGLKFLLTSSEYRSHCLSYITDPIIKDFWSDYGHLKDRDRRQEISSTLNKLNAFLFEPLLRDCLDQRTNRLSFKDTIVLLSFRESTLGAENARLLAALTLATLYVAGVQGTETTLYVDDAEKLTLGPLYRVRGITVISSVTSLSQLRDPLLARRIVAFRTTIEDARVIEPQYELKDNNVLTSLAVLPDFEAYICEGLRATPIAVYPHTHSRTGQGRSIKNRSKSQYNDLMHISSRVERFFV